MSENTVLVHALADLAYSIALADRKLEEQEKNAFNEIIEFGKSARSMKNRFAILDERVSPNIEQTYKSAMFAIKGNKKDFSPDLGQRFVRVIERIAKSVEGLRKDERDLIGRFKTDIKLI